MIEMENWTFIGPFLSYIGHIVFSVSGKRGDPDGALIEFSQRNVPDLGNKVKMIFLKFLT